MNKDQKQNIYDLRGQNVEQQDSVILTKNNFSTMLEIVRQSLGTISLYDLKEKLRTLIKAPQTRDELVILMAEWVAEQQFLDWVTGLKEEELVPPSGTEIIDYPDNQPFAKHVKENVNNTVYSQSKIVDGGQIDHFDS